MDCQSTICSIKVIQNETLTCVEFCQQERAFGVSSLHYSHHVSGLPCITIDAMLPIVGKEHMLPLGHWSQDLDENGVV